MRQLHLQSTLYAIAQLNQGHKSLDLCDFNVGKSKMTAPFVGAKAHRPSRQLLTAAAGALAGLPRVPQHVPRARAWSYRAARHKRLRVVNLVSRPGPDGAKCLGEALKSNTTLTALNIWFSGIGPEGAVSFGKARAVRGGGGDMRQLYSTHWKQLIWVIVSTYLWAC